MTRVAVVIPTHNRSDVLEACLRALRLEKEGDVAFDIVVVDDGSTDDTAAVVESARHGKMMDLLYLRQNRAGPAAARNRGVEATQSDVIIFLGDDIIVERGHISNMLAEFERHGDGRSGAVGLTEYDSSSIPTPFGRWLGHASEFQFAYRNFAAGDEMPFSASYTSNLLVPKDAFVQVGGFDERFKDAAYEDTELGYRLSLLGIRFFFCPAARALHVHPVSVASATRRMEMTAGALLRLRSINLELFYALYPNGDRIFGRPSHLRRAVRWLRGPMVVGPIEFLDDRLHLPLPHALYEGAMRATFSSEVSRHWK